MGVGQIHHDAQAVHLSDGLAPEIGQAMELCPGGVAILQCAGAEQAVCALQGGAAAISVGQIAHTQAQAVLDVQDPQAVAQ